MQVQYLSKLSLIHTKAFFWQKKRFAGDLNPQCKCYNYSGVLCHVEMGLQGIGMQVALGLQAHE